MEGKAIEREGTGKLREDHTIIEGETGRNEEGWETWRGGGRTQNNDINEEVDDITNLRRNKRKIIKIMEKRKIKTKEAGRK